VRYIDVNAAVYVALMLLLHAWYSKGNLGVDDPKVLTKNDPFFYVILFVRFTEIVSI
jgi:hypothetical protein